VAVVWVRERSDRLAQSTEVGLEYGGVGEGGGRIQSFPRRAKQLYAPGAFADPSVLQAGPSGQRKTREYVEPRPSYRYRSLAARATAAGKNPSCASTPRSRGYEPRTRR